MHPGIPASGWFMHQRAAVLGVEADPLPTHCVGAPCPGASEAELPTTADCTDARRRRRHPKDLCLRCGCRAFHAFHISVPHFSVGDSGLRSRLPSLVPRLSIFLSPIFLFSVNYQLFTDNNTPLYISMRTALCEKTRILLRNPPLFVVSPIAIRARKVFSTSFAHRPKTTCF